MITVKVVWRVSRKEDDGGHCGWNESIITLIVGAISLMERVCRMLCVSLWVWYNIS